MSLVMLCVATNELLRRAHGCCVPTPTQRAIPTRSVNEYQWKMGSKRAYHAMH